MDLSEKTVNKNTIYEGKIINVRVDDAELQNGKQCTREVVEHNGGVCVAAITDENEILFVKQFRYPYSKVILELPAGKLNKDENPFTAIQRELLEECGATAEKYIDLGKFYPSPGYCAEIIHLYGATGLTFSEQNLDEDEFLEVERIPFNEAVEMIVNNDIRDGKTQAAVMKMAIRTWYNEAEV